MVIALIGGGMALWLANTPPAYWQPTVATTAEHEQMAIRLENRVPREVTRPREDGEIWQLTITQEEANAWIETRLDKWLLSRRQWLAERNLPSRVPPMFGKIMVGITAKYMALAAEVQEEEDDKPRIFSVEISPINTPDEITRLRLRAVRGGRLPIPVGILETLIEKFGSEEDAREQVVVKAREKIEQTPLTIGTQGGREIHVLNIALTDGAATFTCQTFSTKSDD